MRLETDQAIHDALHSGKPLAIVGLNERNLVQLQLPPGKDYIVMNAEMAREMARLLRYHAARSESGGA